jgi:Protein of unknown function DUF262
MLKPLDTFRALSFQLSSRSLAITQLKNLGTSKCSYSFDDVVHLPSLGINLQRPLVWTLTQKQELIMSILLGRYIPPIALATRKDDIEEFNDRRFVIDGKQRLNTLIAFSQDEFSIELEGELYTFSQLKEVAPDYHKAIAFFYIESAIAYDLTDNQMVEWFLSINFSGTPADESHKEHLMSVLN